jgi:hypothetical protein
MRPDMDRKVAPAVHNRSTTLPNDAFCVPGDLQLSFVLDPVRIEGDAVQYVVRSDFPVTKAWNQSELEVRAALEMELFLNDAIGRRLSEADAVFFLEQLVERRRVKLIWGKPEQWAIENSMTATIFTFDELRENDDTAGEPFYLMDIDII